MKSDSFKNNRKALAALLLCTGFIAAHPLAMRAESSGPGVQTVQQQQIKVTGTVNDDMGPVIGASVVEKGNPSNGTITDIDGNFSLSVKPVQRFLFLISDISRRKCKQFPESLSISL